LCATLQCTGTPASDPDVRISPTWGMVRKFDAVTVRCVETEHVSCTMFKGSCVTGLPFGFMLSMESGGTLTTTVIRRYSVT